MVVAGTLSPAHTGYSNANLLIQEVSREQPSLQASFSVRVTSRSHFSCFHKHPHTGSLPSGRVFLPEARGLDRFVPLGDVDGTSDSEHTGGRRPSFTVEEWSREELWAQCFFLPRNAAGNDLPGWHTITVENVATLRRGDVRGSWASLQARFFQVSAEP